MCFSPQASFVASAFLGLVAVFSYLKLSRSKNYNRKQLGLIIVPLGFAIQQLSEGFVWLSLLHNYSNLVLNLATYVFMFFAFIFWPAYVPACLYQLEQNDIRKDVLRMFRLIGYVTAGLLLGRMLYFGVQAQLANCHIMYTSNLSELSWLVAGIIMAGYLIATVGALLVCSVPGVRSLGFLIGCAYVITYLFYINFLISVWCFFSALVSLLIYQLVLQKD
jgi:hypothetical protein